MPVSANKISYPRIKSFLAFFEVIFTLTILEITQAVPFIIFQVVHPIFQLFFTLV